MRHCFFKSDTSDVVLPVYHIRLRIIVNEMDWIGISALYSMLDFCFSARHNSAEITTGVLTCESCWTMQYTSIWCIALSTPHEADFAALFLLDARASVPSILLQVEFLFWILNPLWCPSCNMSVPVMYYTSLTMTVLVIQKVLLNTTKNPGCDRCLIMVEKVREKVGTVLTYTVPWIF